MRVVKNIFFVFLFLQLHLLQLGCGPSSCVKAAKDAADDFGAGVYYLHSIKLTPAYPNTYIHLLERDYNIDWRFIPSDSAAYYSCYDSTMASLLESKYGSIFLRDIRIKADSLDNTPNWLSDAEFLGGNHAMMKYIVNRLHIADTLRGVPRTRVFVKFTVDTEGELEDIEILRGIHSVIDSQVVAILEGMPKWKPAYVYGKPSRSRLAYPITFEFR